MDLTIGTILIIVLCVITAGLAMARLFGRIDRPHLIVFAGSRSRLLAIRAGVWAGALVVSVLAWIVLSSLLPTTVALALFFAFEAVVLDICGQRIGYVRAMPPLASYRAPRSLRTGAI